MKKVISLLLSAVIISSSMALTNTYVFAGESTDSDSKNTFISTAEQMNDQGDDTLLGKEDTNLTGYTKPESNSSSTGYSIFAASKSGSCGAKVKFTLASDGTLTISGTGAMTNYANYDDVPWQSYMVDIKKVVISSGVTSISDYAFYNGSSITAVSIPNTINKIGQCAFAFCSTLKSVTLPSAVKVIPYAAFADCFALTSFTAPGLTTVEEFAFQRTAMKSFKIVKTLTSIAPKAFFDNQITVFSVESGNTVFSVKNNALVKNGGKTLFAYPAGNTSTSYSIPSTITKIADGAFVCSSNLKSITIPNSVKTIGELAFYKCNKLKSITIPDSVTKLGDCVFCECMDLATVNIGDGLTVIPDRAFDECYSLATVNWGASVQKLGALAFADCYALKTITIPKTVKEIYNACFGDCSALERVEFKGVIKEIPFQTFFGCTNLKTVIIPEGLKTIYRSAFHKCTSLTSITLPKSTHYVHNVAFPATTKVNNLNANLRKFGRNGWRYLEDISISGTRNYTEAYKVLDLVNKERKAKGKTPLKMDKSLLESAMKRADELSVLFSHTRPDGSTIFEMSDLIYGENIAVGAGNAAGAMDLWMNSEGHRENILSSDHKSIGIGCFIINGNYYWVQNFGINENPASFTKPSNTKINTTVPIATEPFSEGASNSGVIFGSNDEYSYKLVLKLDSSVNGGAAKNAALMLENSAFQIPIPINNTAAWSSSNTAAATVKNGKVTGVHQGKSTIKAKLKYYSAKKNINVSGHSYKTTVTKATMTKDGKIYNKCTVCGATSTSTIAKASTILLTYHKNTFTENSKVQRPTIFAMDANGNELTYKKDFTVDYSNWNSTNVGRYTVTVKLIGNYSGTKTFTYYINPKPTEFLPSNKGGFKAISKGFTLKWNKQTNQTTGYQIQYATKSDFSNAATVTVANPNTTSYTFKNRAGNTRYYVRIRTYKKIGNGTFYSNWNSGTKSVVTLK